MIELKNIDPQMIANNLTPFHPTHPGEVIKEEIEFRGLSQRKLAEQMGVAYSQLNEVLNCKRQLSTEMALLLEAALGLNAEPLLNMQLHYNMQTVRSSSSFMQRLGAVRRIAAVL